MKQCQFTNNWRNYVMVFFAEKQCWVATPKYKKGQFSKAKHGLGGMEVAASSFFLFLLYIYLLGRKKHKKVFRLPFLHAENKVEGQGMK